MQKYICLLRGVNMTGHNSLKMGDLADLFRELGFTDVQTYIQSGNVIFRNNSGDPESVLRSRIEEGIKKRFDYNIAVMLRTEKQLKDLAPVNPFLDEDDFSSSKMAVIFLHDPVTVEQADKVKGVSYPPDKFHIAGSEIFIYCPGGFGRTKLYTNFFESRMKVTGTARNWKTVQTISELLGV
jgi:uncharacterized protein (DUF1697 family)